MPVVFMGRIQHMDKQTSTMSPRWLSLEAASNYSGVSKRLVEIWRDKGFIKSANITMPGATRGRRVFDRLSIDSYIEAFVGAPVSKIGMNKGGQQ